MTDPQGVEVLARGPVHEAYAQPGGVPPEPSPVVTKQPPEAIEEVPPEQKPEGDNIEWIAGYWAWDEDRKDFIWISGFWRESPPDRDWVSGNWQKVTDGWQWVAGFWAPTNTTELQYLPPPPQSVDEGASTPAPDATSTYIPGSWVYSTNRYMWRPGYWAPYNANYVWIPSYYTWTPSGYLYVNGYWDHPLDDRGLLFAPVHFGPNWNRVRYVPSYVVSSDFLLGALFVRTGFQLYYFGNYFENRYAGAGFVAWPNYRWGRAGYDPNFNYYRNYYGGNARWEAGVRDLYRARLDGTIARPPLNYNQQVQALAAVRGTGAVNPNINITQIQNVTALVPLREIGNTRATGLATLAPNSQKAEAGRLTKLRNLAENEVNNSKVEADRQRQLAIRRQETQADLAKRGVPSNYTDPARAVNWDMKRPGVTPKEILPPKTPGLDKNPPAKLPDNKTPPVKLPENKTPPVKMPPDKGPPAKLPDPKNPPAKLPEAKIPPVKQPEAGRPPRVAPPAIPQLPKQEERPLPKIQQPPVQKGPPPKEPPAKGGKGKDKDPG